MRISFYPADESVSKFVVPPKPATQYIPEWYKKLPPIKEKEIKFSEQGSVVGLGLKACLPFIDGMTAGYIQETWADISISRVNDSIFYGHHTNPALLKTRERPSVKIAPHFYDIEFTWQTYWRAKLPKGYSLLITHPINRLDLPFITMTGLVDSDEFYHTPKGNIPFFINQGFEGVIPAGTPMFQMIPVKRDIWDSFVEPFDAEATQKRENEIRKYLYGGYRKLFRQKKVYR